MLRRYCMWSMCGLLAVLPATGLTAPSTVLYDAGNVGKILRAEAKLLTEQQNAENEARTALRQLQERHDQLEKAYSAKKEAVDQARAALYRAEEVLSKLLIEKIAWQQDEAAINNDLAQAKRVMEQAKREVEWAEAEREAADLAAQQAAGTKQEAAADAAYVRAERAEGRVAERLEQAIAAVEAQEAKLAALADKTDVVAGQRELVEAAKLTLADEEAQLQELDAEIQLNQTDQAGWQAMLRAIDAPADLKVRRWQTKQLEGRYYSWKDAKGNSGHQWVQPITFGSVDKKWEYNVQTDYVVSNNKSAADGRVSTLTDTTLGIAYSQQRPRGTLTYQLDVNIPTGKATLPGDHATMSDDLVEHGRFGEGWNFSPGVFWSQKNGRENTVTLGTYYAILGSYTPNSLSSDTLHPGNSWVKTARWMHVEKQYQFLAEVTHTSSGRATEGDAWYNQGNQWATQLTYNRALAADRNLLLYFWYNNAAPYSYAVPRTDANSTNAAQHWGAIWSKDINPNRTVRFAAAYMKRRGDSYNPLTEQYASKRDKYILGAGYDIALNKDSALSFDVERAYMREGGASENGYHSWNFFVKYNVVK